MNKRSAIRQAGLNLLHPALKLLTATNLVIDTPPYQIDKSLNMTFRIAFCFERLPFKHFSNISVVIAAVGPFSQLLEHIGG